MKPFTPHITKLPKRTVLTVTTVGDPNKVTQSAMQALYGTAYGTKFKVYKPKRKVMTMSPPSAFWPDAAKKPKSRWTAHWMLDVPSFVKQKDLLQKNPTMAVKVKTLPAATVAEILHIGPYSAERPTIKKLHAFIKEQKLEIAGPHEEVYLSRPGPKAKTVVRYVVKPRSGVKP